MPFLSGYQQLKIPIIDKAGNPAWPELFSVEKIDEIRQIVGPRHFSAQMMLEFVDVSRARLDPGALNFYDEEFECRTAKIGDNKISGCAIYWDPSSGRKRSDGSVCVLIYRDDVSHRIFLHDILYLSVSDEELHPLAKQCEMVLLFMRHYGVRRIAIETNGIGNALPEIMRDCASRSGQDIYVQKIINNKNKETRILNTIEPVLTTGRMFAHRRIQNSPLVSEMLGWSPIGGRFHDDGLDAVAGAMLVVSTPVRPIGNMVKPVIANTTFCI